MIAGRNDEENDKLGLTELKARDASCPKGKKMSMRMHRTIGICKGDKINKR